MERRWKQRFIIKALLILWNVSMGQTGTYKDVLVIINTQSAVSERIGSYFAQERNIPPSNIVRISTSTSEEIDSTTFQQLRQQVENALRERNLVDSINYIVTTKGMPLKVRYTNSACNASVESELMLILGPYASLIGKSGRGISPYYRKSTDFTRAQYGIYLVTRLDGYDENDILALIDRTSVIPSSVPSLAQFLFDQDPTWNSLLLYLNTNMTTAATQLRNRGYNTLLDTTTVFLTHQTNILGYVSWGSNDRNVSLYTENAIPHHSWLPGAIAETYVSTSARTFAFPPEYSQSLIADLIREGVSAAKGYVYEPYASAMCDVRFLFPMYVDGYNVAEAFFASSPSLSWMDVVIGDPKYRVVQTRLPGDAFANSSDQNEVLPVQLTQFHVSASGQSVTVEWETATEVQCYGFEIERRCFGNAEWMPVGFVAGAGTSNVPHQYIFTDKSVQSGKYEYRLKQVDVSGSETYFSSAEVEIGEPEAYAVVANYPNPFNPVTNIQVTLPRSGFVKIHVYTMLGQEVETLFEGVVEKGGVFSVPFDGGSFPTGTYFCVLEYEGHRTVHKMMLMR